MKTTLIASALIALSVVSGSAFAQRGDHGNGRNDQMQQQNNDRNDTGTAGAFAERRDQAGDQSGRNDRTQQDTNRHAEGSAFARRSDQVNGHDDHNDQMQQRDNDRRDNGRMAPRGNSESHRNDYYAHQYHRDDTRGGGPRHDLRRGQRLSREYRDNRYVVNDWRAHRLSAPPRGQHWVRAGNDYVLATTATGLIAQVLLGN